MASLPKVTAVGDAEVFASTTDARDALFAIMSDSRDYLTEAAAWKDAFISSNLFESQLGESTRTGRTNVLETMYGASYRWIDKVLQRKC